MNLLEKVLQYCKAVYKNENGLTKTEKLNHYKKLIFDKPIKKIFSKKYWFYLLAYSKF